MQIAGPAEAGRLEGDAIRVGISACLLGEAVRYDGGHKRAAFLLNAFGPSVRWISICPEVEAGFGTPREAMQLWRSSEGVRLITVTTRRDVTASMDEGVRRIVQSLGGEDLSGYILKANSPSCGLEEVKVYERDGVPSPSGRGLFAEALIRAFPLLPVEEEGRLSDPPLLDDFVARVFAYHRVGGRSG